MIKSYDKDGIHVLYNYYSEEPEEIRILEVSMCECLLDLSTGEEERIKAALYKIENGQVGVEI